MSSINQKEYLKKYLGIGKASGEKKKKKKSKKLGNGLKIVDDDINVDMSKEIQLDLNAADDEEAPQIVSVIDDRPPSLRVDEVTKNNLWKPLGTPDTEFDPGKSLKFEGTIKMSKILVGGDLKQNKLSNKHQASISKSSSSRIIKTDDYSLSRKSKTNHDLDILPPRRQKNKQHNFDEMSSKKIKSESDNSSSPRRQKCNSQDSSPPRKIKKEKSEVYSPRRRPMNDSNDSSPPRRSKRVNSEDNSPPRRQKHNLQDSSPPRKIKREKSEDYSPPRSQRNNLSDSSHRRSKGENNEDNSPPRKRKENSPHSSPLRKIKREKSEDHSPPRRCRNHSDDSSPPRRFERRKSKDNSPPRRGRYNSEDSSPPRRFKNEKSQDSSPSKDNSPPRKKKHHLEDSSPTRRSKKNDSPPRRSKNKSRWGHWEDEQSSEDKLTKTLDGKKAGLQNAANLVLETKEFKRKEDELFRNMSAEISGANAATIVRGNKKDEVDWEEEEKRRKRDEENKEKYNRWGKGLKQVEDINEKIKNDLHEMNKPLARYADDEDLEKYLKDQEREGDPMLAYIRQKKKKNAVNKGKPEIQQYEGDAPANRFGIRPGYRWDGVNRSNGYEQRWFEVQNSRKASIEETYKWSTEDM